MSVQDVGQLALEMLEDMEEHLGEDTTMDYGVVLVAYRTPDGQSGVAFRASDACDWKMRGILTQALSMVGTGPVNSAE